MRIRSTPWLALVLSAGLPLAVHAQEAEAADAATGPVEVADAAIATGVQERQPVDTLSAVPADIGEVFGWTRVTGFADRGTVVHVWYHDGEEMARVPLRVASPDWRTWSTKQILPSWTGPWRLEVLGPDGETLATLNFTVEEPTGSGG